MKIVTFDHIVNKKTTQLYLLIQPRPITSNKQNFFVLKTVMCMNCGSILGKTPHPSMQPCLDRAVTLAKKMSMPNTPNQLMLNTYASLEQPAKKCLEHTLNHKSRATYYMNYSH